MLGARRRQWQRSRCANAHLPAQAVPEVCAIGLDDQRLLERAIEKLSLSARAYIRILKLARTIADLAGADRIETAHLTEAIGYRRFER